MTRKMNKRTMALIACVALCLSVVVGGTVAYLFANSNSVENTFTPSRVACEVIPGAGDTYKVKNTGDTAAFVRVAVVATWEKDGMIYVQKPDVKITLGNAWVPGTDGYYYYESKIPVGASTEDMIVKLATNAVQPEGYTLSVEVVASAVQPTNDAVLAWSNNIASTDGNSLTVTQRTP